jgi:hypothetical protein
MLARRYLTLEQPFTADFYRSDITAGGASVA